MSLDMTVKSEGDCTKMCISLLLTMLIIYFLFGVKFREYPKVCVNLQTDVR